MIAATFAISAAALTSATLKRRLTEQQKYEAQEARRPRCPDCGSTNVGSNPARCFACGFCP